DCTNLPGSVCSGGHCVCPAGQHVCGGACIDITSDPSNCGHCGAACDTSVGQTCSGGVCRCPHGNQTLCPDHSTGGNACVNTASNNENCGRCGNQCGLCTDGLGNQHSRACVAGQCAPPAGFSQCGNVCAD